MSKFIWIFVGMALAVFLYTARIDTRPAQANNSEPLADPKCVKKRRQHAYDTYQAHYATSGDHGWVDDPIDLTIVECLEWEAK